MSREVEGGRTSFTEREKKLLREKLIGLRDRLRGEIGRRGQAIIDDVQDPGALSTVPTHPADHDDEGVEEEVEVGEAQTAMLDDVESALERMDQGSYGRCTRCGKSISAERLEALPYAAHCIRCERVEERRRADRT